MINSKQKGSAFEREIIKKLSLWVSEGKSDDLFWRSAMSGGRATVRSKKGQETASGHGDITAVRPEGNKLTDRYVIECKHYKSIGLDKYVYGQGPLVEIWEKLRKGHDKKPMLIFKENRKPIMVGLNFPINWICGLVIYWSDLSIYYFDDLLSLDFDKFIN
jgi:hypothetical protein